MIEFSRCPLCDGKYERLYNLSHSNIVRCLRKGCGLVFAQCQPSEQELNELYNSTYYLENDGAYSRSGKQKSDRHKFKQTYKYLNNRLCLDGKRILDYGCGFGRFLEVTREEGINDAMGVETNELARCAAREKGFRVEDSISKYANESFDLIYMNDVIEHLRDPVAELRKIREFLAVDGAVFIVSMNIKGLKAKLLGKSWELITDPTHFFFYGNESFVRTLHKAGYAKVSIVRNYVNFSHHNFLRRLLQRGLVRFGFDTGLKALVFNGPDTSFRDGPE